METTRVPQNRKCEYPGCNRRGMPKGKKGGRAKLCTKHHKQKYGMHIINRLDRLFAIKGKEAGVVKMSRQPCSRCGWSKSFCDRHRLIPQGPYTEENTIPLCPNCHRAETMKMLGHEL